MNDPTSVSVMSDPTAAVGLEATNAMQLRLYKLCRDAPKSMPRANSDPCSAWKHGDHFSLSPRPSLSQVPRKSTP